MNQTEAATLITGLVAFFPGIKFGLENAQAYETGIMDLPAPEVQHAIGELVQTANFIPPVAAIRTQVMLQRKLARDRRVPAALRLPEGNAPTKLAWYDAQKRLEESGERHQAMAEAWYRSKGKAAPPDPAQVFIDLCKAGASGEDVRSRFQREVMHQDDSERRFP